MAEIILDSMVRVPKDALSVRQLRTIREALCLRTQNSQTGKMETVYGFKESKTHLYLPRQWSGSRRILNKNRSKVTDQRSRGSEVQLAFHSNKGWRKGQLAFLENVLDGLRRDKLGGIGKAGCGFGKTVMGCAVAAKLGMTTLVIVHTEPIMQEWVKSAREFLKVEPGIVQADRCEFEDHQFVVAMVNSLALKDYPKELYEWPGLVIFDECLTGDTRVVTELGEMPLTEVPWRRPKYVLSFNEREERWEWKRLLRWIPQGHKQTLVIRTEIVDVRCTSNHKFLTERGWVEAGNLKPGDRILSPVNADAGTLSPNFVPMESRADSYSDIKSKRPSTANNDAWDSRESHRSADADAEARSSSQPRSKTLVSPNPNGPGSCPATIVRAVIGRLCRMSALGSYTGRCSETLPSASPTLQPTLESAGTTALPKPPGPLTKQSASQGSVLSYTRQRIGGLAKRASMAAVAVTRGLFEFLGSSVTQRTPVWSGCRPSQKKAGLGGTWTTAPSVEEAFGFTQRASASNKSVSSPTLSEDSVSLMSKWTKSVNSPTRHKPNGTTGYSDSERKVLHDGSTVLSSSLPQEWSTSSIEVLSIERTGEVEQVFDLEIEDNHNFVANGLLVHNCHHVPAMMFLKALTRFPARYYFGLTATPRRADQLQNLFFWTIGGILAEGVGENLDCRVWRLRYYPSIDWNDILDKKGKPSYSKFLKLLSEDPKRNALLARVAVKAVREGRKVLLLTKFIEHIEDLRARIELMFERRGESYTAGHYLAGKTKKHEAARERARGCDVVLATDRMAKEGFNVEDLDTFELALPMKDIEQAVGRIRRLLEGKKEPIIVEIADEHPFVRGMNEERLVYYRSKQLDKSRWPVHLVK